MEYYSKKAKKYYFLKYFFFILFEKCTAPDYLYLLSKSIIKMNFYFEYSFLKVKV